MSFESRVRLYAADETHQGPWGRLQTSTLPADPRSIHNASEVNLELLSSVQEVWKLLVLQESEWKRAVELQEEDPKLDVAEWASWDVVEKMVVECAVSAKEYLVGLSVSATWTIKCARWVHRRKRERRQQASLPPPRLRALIPLGGLACAPITDQCASRKRRPTVRRLRVASFESTTMINCLSFDTTLSVKRGGFRFITFFLLHWGA